MTVDGMPEHLEKPPVLRALDAFLNDETDWEKNCNELLAKLQNVKARIDTDARDLADVLEYFGLLKHDRQLPKAYLDQITVSLQQRARKCEFISDPPPDGADVQNVVLVDEIKLLKEGWFKPRPPGDNNSCALWSKDAGPVEGILRDALVELIQLRLRTRKPVDGYWMCAGEDSDPFKKVNSPGFRCYVTWSPYQITFLILTPEEPDDGPQQAIPEGPQKGYAQVSHHHVTSPTTGLRGEKYAAISGPDRRESGILVVKPAHPQSPEYALQPGESRDDLVVRAYDLGKKAGGGGAST